MILLGFWARSQLTKDTDDHVPTKLQLDLGDRASTRSDAQVEDNLGQVNPYRRRRSPSREFFFILICELDRDDPDAS